MYLENARKKFVDEYPGKVGKEFVKKYLEKYPEKYLEETKKNIYRKISNDV